MTLGNQMFQYAFLLGLHSKYGYDIAIPSSDFKNAWRQHQLFQAFKLKSLKKENIIRIDRDNFIREKQFHFDEDIFNNAPDNADYLGYFQSEKYFKNCKDLVKENFEFLDHIQDKCSKFMQQFKGKTVLSIQVRRGDNIGRSHQFPIPNEEYFNKCFEIVGNYDYAIVFSDDYEWCKEQKIFEADNILISKSYDPVNYCKDEHLVSNNSNLYDLCLMTMCDKHIISNSSFGWWGAWLADSRMVCYPNPWFGESYMNNLHPDFQTLINLKDLCPVNWTKVDYKNNPDIIYSYVNGNKILVSPDTVIRNSYTWMNDGIWDLNVIEKFTSYIKDGFNILDIGAQSGCFSLAAKFYSNTKWFSFEPDSLNYSLLIDNLKLNSIQNVKTYQQALSDNLGEKDLNICSNHRGLNTLGNNLTRFSKENLIKEKVILNTIDNLFLNTRIDLIKIDTEGSEYDILVGGLKTIQKYKPLILLEYFDENLKQFNHNIQELDHLIEKIGYEIIWKHEDNVIIQSIIL